MLACNHLHLRRSYHYTTKPYAVFPAVTDACNWPMSLRQQPFIRARMQFYKYFADCIPNSKKRDNPPDGHPYPYYRPTLDRVHGLNPRLTIGHRRRQWMEPTIDLSLRSALPILSYTAPSSFRGVSLKQNLNNMDLLRLIFQKGERWLQIPSG